MAVSVKLPAGCIIFIVVLAVPAHPPGLEPVTIYVVVPAGSAPTVVPFIALSPVAGDQV